MQKFQKGDLVRVAKDLGPNMSHFTADCDAIVIGSYADEYGGSNRGKFTLHLKGLGRCSWYHASQLTLIESGRLDKLKAWEDEADAERKQKSDLDWIFANGQAVAEKTPGASVHALAECLGLTDLWGRNGDGVAYYCSAMVTIELAKPYLKAMDKAGWLAHCELLRREAQAAAAANPAPTEQTSPTG